MRNILTLLISLLSFVVVSAQTQQRSIIIDEQSFAPVQTDVMHGVAIDKIQPDNSRRPCARIKMHVNRMTREEIDGLVVRPIGGNVVIMRQMVATEGNGLIIELTAKQPTRFYLHHDKYGDSNEVSLNLEGDKEYRLSAQLNISYPIVIATNVIDAEVYIDGMYQGRSDSGYTLTVNDITPGTHKLRVQSGSSIAEQNIEVSSTAIYFRLDVNVASSRPQYVVFSVTPKNAIVVVDNKNCVPDADGIVQLTLNNGSYNYHISANSYHDERGTFVVSGSKVEKYIELRPAHGWVEVGSSSHLKGASVYIDGNYIGKAPIKSDKLASGTYKVKIIKELYLPYVGEITIKDNETLKFNPSLTDNFAIVTITVGDGASIYVNNTYKGKSSWTGNLEAGAYIFEARKEGYRTTTISRNITTQAKNQNIILDAPTPIIGYVDINSSPAIASVTIDGNNVGNTPIIQDLLIGEHTIVVSKQGYKSQTVKTTIKEGATEKLTITLQKETSEKKSNTQSKYASASSQSSTTSGLGSIYITSVPVNAKVYIDGMYIGQTPIKSDKLASGTHKVKIIKELYLPYEGEITIKDNETLKFNPSLTDNFAIVTITVGDGASIYVNNAYKGMSSWTGNLEAGAYIFEARKEGHRTTTISRNITTQAKNQNIILDAPTPITGYLNLTSTPKMATVNIDGKDVGETPLMEELLIGTHEISVQMSGYRKYTQRVTIAENQTKNLNISLQKGSDNTDNTDNTKNNVIEYVMPDKKMKISEAYSPQFGANIKSHTWDPDTGKGVITFMNDVTKIGNDAFRGCTSLTSVTIPDSVTSIGWYAFYNCSSLTSVIIPDSVTAIGWYAFYSCTSLTSITIGDSVMEIGDYAFFGCSSLTSVYCKATIHPVLRNTYVFDDNGSGRKIYVPMASVEAYKSAYRWSEYADAIVGYNF